MRLRNTLLTLAAVAAVLVIAHPAVADITTGLQNYYSFDNSGNPGNDDSGNTRHGTVTGATWVNDSVLGGSLEFDGSDVVTAAVPQLPGGGLTVSFWALRNSSHSGGNDGLFVVHDGNASNKNVGGWVAGNDRVWGRIRAPGNRNLPQNDYAKMPGDDLWTHVTYRADGSTYELLLDGASTGNSVTYNSGSFPTTNTLTIGRQGTESWRGRIDDFRLYSRALSDVDISELVQINNSRYTLNVDFSNSINDGGGPDAAIPGFIAFQAAEGGGNPEHIRTYASAMGIGGTVDVTVGGYTHFRDYADATGIFADLSPLLSDNALRNANGTLTLSLDNFTSGTYEITTYHHTTQFFGNRTFDILLSDAAGTDQLIASGVAMSGNSSSALSTQTFEFVVDKGSTVEIEFPVSGSTGHFALDGFQVHLVPEPGTLLIWALLAALAIGAGWRRRSA